MNHRLYARRGTELTHAKLNETLVARIRAEHAEKERKKRELDEMYSAAAFAKRYGVHKNTIDKILNFSSWVHVR